MKTEKTFAVIIELINFNDKEIKGFVRFNNNISEFILTDNDLGFCESSDTEILRGAIEPLKLKLQQVIELIEDDEYVSDYWDCYKAKNREYKFTDSNDSLVIGVDTQTSFKATFPIDIEKVEKHLEFIEKLNTACSAVKI